MKLLRHSLRRWRLLALLACTLPWCMSSVESVSAQTYRGTYCIAWDKQIRPTRIVASGNVLAGETVNLIIPPPTNPDSIQYVALSWGTNMNMPDTSCMWRVVPATGSYLLQPPLTGATLWEWQIVEVDVRTHDPRNPQVRDIDLDQLPVPGSVQYSLQWALQDGVVEWLIAIPLGAYLAREWIWSIRRMVRGWFETSASGDEEWERYNQERGIYYDEERNEFYRIDDDHRA